MSIKKNKTLPQHLQDVHAFESPTRKPKIA